MKPVVAAKTDVGRVRQGNEDSFLVQEPLFAVADGMGGHLGGEIASATTVETITRAAQVEPPHDSSRLAAIVREANAAVWDEAQGDPELKGMGTTCTLVLLEGDELHIAHVGDSRAYLLRAGELTQVTEDHTLVNRMVREGRLKPEEADRHPQRSIITRALGVDAEVEVDELSLGVEEGDRFLLCSDGLTSMIDFAALRDTLAHESAPQSAVDRLIELANEAGGEDNITVVLVDIVDDAAVEPAPRPASTQIPAPQHRETTDPEVAPVPPSVDTGVHRLDSVPASRQAKAEHRSRVPRLLGLALLLILVIGAAAFAATRYTLSNSYFVGTSEDGMITIYRGIPEEVAGMSLKESEERTDVAVSDLPDFLRGDVEEGIKADSLEDARTKVENLEERASDSDFNKDSAGGNNN
jgi:protein phosphatase